MRFLRTIIALAFAFTAALPGFAASNSADLPHVHVQLIAPDAQFHPGANKAGLYFKLEPGWHVYWKNPGDAGEPPRIKWTLSQGVSAGALQYPVPKRLPLGPLMDFGYEDEVVFPFQVDVASAASSGSATLQAKVSWLVCRGSCIPEKTELAIVRPIGQGTESAQPDQQIWARLAVKLPQAPPANLKIGFAPTAIGFRLTVITGQKEAEASFFPSKPDILSNPAPQKVTPTANGLTLDLKKDETLTANPKELTGLFLLSNNRAYELIVPLGSPKPAQAAPPEAAPASSTASAGPSAAGSSSSVNSVKPAQTGLLRAAALAFLGGLILNLMPCVFPVLFIKGLSLVQSGAEEKHKLRTHGLVYTLGILVSFWMLVGVLLGLRSAGSHLGWGFQFQSPVFLSLMAALLFFLGLSLAGQFEIGLTLTGAGGSLAAKQGYTGSFFTGVLAVIVATPCTAPFMGVALGYALSQTGIVTFAVFTALALGLAAPYLALTLQPAWTRILPRPGAWMEVLKQAVSVPIFGTVIWLAWVIANAYGAAMLAALLCSFLLLAIAGWFLGRWPAKAWSTWIAGLVVITVVWVCVVAPRELTPSTSNSSVNAVASKTGEGWQPWSAEGVTRYQSQGRPIFVDFTASWCLSCQVNERVALGKPEVQKAFADSNVVLMRADWTRYDDSITRVLNSFGRSGVPTYALYVPGESQPRLLPEVLTPGIVTDALAQLPHGSTQSSASNAH
ncbi:protein-disulfide reductase DsbD family protein [Occallatibacter savannae]|uniref:protein-disulfide reductase DsbD family protein n=1 Tax=Occallatibacter savannae TaxID=1002691 RepID=UPI000D690527|nr:protein-disulfide reductase DsbD domain-containing protein [Occallatibacter savannae]